MNVITSPPHIEIVGNNQGGAALGAIVAGANVAFHESTEHRFHFVGLGGTSSGAQTSVAAAEGLIHGADDKDGGNMRAAAKIKHLWFEQLPGHYERTIGLYTHMMNAGHEVCEAVPPLRLQARAWRQCLTLFSEMMSGRITPITNHVFDFLDDLEKRGEGFDFKAIQTSTLPVFINATHVSNGGDPYQAKTGDERIFRNSHITKLTLAASGTVAEFMTPIIHDGERLYDGAYSTNPHLTAPAALCQQQGAQLVVFRTRPDNAYGPLHGKTPEKDEERRAFFNNMLDEQLESLRQDRPNLPVHVVKPESLETQRRLWKPELCFDRRDIATRFEAGYKAAQAVIAEITQPSWLQRKADRAMRVEAIRSPGVVQAQVAAA